MPHQNPQQWPQTRGPLEVALAKSMPVRATLLDSSGASLSQGLVQASGQGLETARVTVGITLRPATGQGTLCVLSSSCWVLAGPCPSQPGPILSPPSPLLTQSIGQ